MTHEEVHEAYCDILTRNWTGREWVVYSDLFRTVLGFRIIVRDPLGHEFMSIWKRTFSLNEEVRLAGEAIAALSSSS